MRNGRHAGICAKFCNTCERYFRWNKSLTCVERTHSSKIQGVKLPVSEPQVKKIVLRTTSDADKYTQRLSPLSASDGRRDCSSTFNMSDGRRDCSRANSRSPSSRISRRAHSAAKWVCVVPSTYTRSPQAKSTLRYWGQQVWVVHSFSGDSFPDGSALSFIPTPPPRPHTLYGGALGFLGQ